MDIEGLGEEMINQLVDAGPGAQSMPDLYRLKLDQLLELERMGEKSSQNLLDGIEASKQRGLARLLAGLAIPHVGEAVADLLAKEFGNIDALLTRHGGTTVADQRRRPDHGQGDLRILPQRGGDQADRRSARPSASR